MKKLKVKRRTEKGITLVALVITIIIIIILATVTINMAFGDNGLIKQAELARDMAANSIIHEEDSMANLTAYMNEIMTGGTSGAKTLVQAFEDGDIAVGDYVNYTPTAVQRVSVGKERTGYDETQNFSTDMNTTWRVLGLSEDGNHLLLTSGSPIKKEGENPYLVLQGAAGYLNGIGVLDEIAGIYHNSTVAEETRSITLEDIERALEVIVEYPEVGGEGYVYLKEKNNNNIIGVSVNGTYTYTANDYTPESAIKNPIEYAPIGKTVETKSYLLYYSYEGYKAMGIDSRMIDTLFKDIDTNKPYWLATQGIASGSVAGGESGVTWGIGSAATYISDGSSNYWLFATNGKYGLYSAEGFAVKPVVKLRTNITIEQIYKIEDKEEEVWDATWYPSLESGVIHNGVIY